MKKIAVIALCMSAVTAFAQVAIKSPDVVVKGRTFTVQILDDQGKTVAEMPISVKAGLAESVATTARVGVDPQSPMSAMNTGSVIAAKVTMVEIAPTFAGCFYNNDLQQECK